MTRGAVFDLDGTLFDSMYIWDGFACNFLRYMGIEADKSAEEAVRYMSLPEAAEYFISEFNMNCTAQELMQKSNAMLEDEYFNKIRLRPGVRELLAALNEQGIPKYIATATDRYLAEAALRREGVIDEFSGIVTCTEAGAGKSKPDIYFAACRALGTSPGQTWVFEDAYHAVKTAAEAGFKVCAVEDETESDHKNEIKALADIYTESFLQLDVRRLLR